MIYLDNAADTYPKPLNFWNNDSLSPLKNTVAQFFKATPEQIFFTSSAKEALYTVIHSLKLNENSTVYLTSFEPDVTIRTVSVRKYQDGIRLFFLPIDPNTAVPDWKALKQQFFLYPPDVVIINQVGSLTGAITPAEDIFSKAHAYGAVTILDAAQSAGILPIEFEKMQADILIFSGHKKLYGKQGCGGFLCKRENIFETMPDILTEEQISQPVLESLCKTLLWGMDGQREKLQKEQELSAELLEGLQAFSDTVVLGPALEKERTGIVTFALHGYSEDWLVNRIKQEGQIVLRTARDTEPYLSEWLKTIQVEKFVRASFGWFNTQEEVRQLLKTIEGLCKKTTIFLSGKTD